MSLIEIYHVVADMYPVDPDWTNQIIEGHFVMLDANGLIHLSTGAANTVTIGVAGDTLSNTTPGTPFSNWPFGSLVVGSKGSPWGTVNRVSDFMNETVASGLMTVYHSGGRFASNVYDVVNYVVGQALYTNDHGHLTNIASVNAQVVATVVATPAAWPSGVPGTDIDQSISLGDYIDFKLEI